MTLPIFDVQQTLQTTLNDHPITLLQAPPGSGKTSWVPIWLHQLGGRVLLIQPRRIAVLNAVRQLARNIEEEPGFTVGYRMRFETRLCKQTAIEVVTEGVFIRLLQADPELADYHWVIFDEFHERSLDADLGLTLVRSSQELFRPDLKILLMSATLNESQISQQLQAPVVKSDGRAFPVRIIYQTPLAQELSATVLTAVRQAMAIAQGNILVFLPGIREIQSCQDELLRQNFYDIQIDILHGSCSIEEQKRALELTDQRKLILSSPVAESSITLPDITVVIDSGLARFPKFDRDTGMTRLITRKISKANADQRAGRAGRTAPGLCIRLWSKDQHNGLAPFPPVEIEQADYTRMLLDIAAWGADIDELSWLTPPNPTTVAETVTMLKSIAALQHDAALRITAHGQTLLSIPCHPRLAHMICAHPGDMAVKLAVLLQERVVPQGPLDQQWLNQPLNSTERQLQQRLSALVPKGQDSDWMTALCHAFPDHIGKTIATGKVKLVNGQQLLTPEHGLRSQWLLALKFNDKRVLSWVELDNFDCDAFPQLLNSSSSLALHDGRLRARELLQFGKILLKERNSAISTEQRLQFWDEYFQRYQFSQIHFTDDTRILLKRLTLMAQFSHDEQWPGRKSSVLEFLLEHRRHYLLPFCGEANSLAEIEITRALDMMLTWEQRQAMEIMIPASIVVNGKPRSLTYGEQQRVSIAIKLQETFGLVKNPTIANGQIPIIFELLSPAGRPLQITSDLEYFWRHNYQDIRKEMRGRYPKHPWPEDPITAKPTAFTKRQSIGREM